MNRPRAGDTGAMDRPTTQELRILGALRDCGTAASAAELLCLSVRTVEGHLDSLRRKSGLRPMRQVMAWAYDNGWLAPVAAEA